MDEGDNKAGVPQVTIETVTDALSKQPGVRGVVISDHAGRCMSASGSLPSSAASRIKTILDAAVALGDGNEIPIVTIDTEKGTTTISGTNGVYTAVASPAPDPK